MVVPLIVACALFMQNLDTSIINTALPSIAISFHDSPVRLSMAVTAYMLALAVFIPVSGWIADRFGARTVFRAAIGVFLLGSPLWTDVIRMSQAPLIKIIHCLPLSLICTK